MGEEDVMTDDSKMKMIKSLLDMFILGVSGKGGAEIIVPEISDDADKMP